MIRRITMSFSVSEDARKAIDDYAERYGLTKSEAVNRIILNHTRTSPFDVDEAEKLLERTEATAHELEDMAKKLKWLSDRSWLETKKPEETATAEPDEPSEKEMFLDGVRRRWSRDGAPDELELWNMTAEFQSFGFSNRKQMLEALERVKNEVEA